MWYVHRSYTVDPAQSDLACVQISPPFSAWSKEIRDVCTQAKSDYAGNLFLQTYYPFNLYGRDYLRFIAQILTKQWFRLIPSRPVLIDLNKFPTTMDVDRSCSMAKTNSTAVDENILPTESGWNSF